MQNKRRKTSTLEANRALFTADENVLIDKLLECGQEHLFEHWPAPGDAALSDRVQALIEAAGFPCPVDEARGYDHGVFIPLKVAFPQADIPCVQLSLRSDLDPAAHIAVGRALAPLRDEGQF